MNISIGWFGNIDFTDWVRGLVSAVISGGASAVTSGFVMAANDPAKYAVGTSASLKLMTTFFLINGFLAGMNFLRTKPLPELKTVTTTTETTEHVKSPAATVVTTVEEVKKVPVDEPAVR